MERDIIGELNNYYNSLQNQFQMQTHKKKMSMEQIQELSNCIKILGNAMSYAENYSMMNGNKLNAEFKNYDYYYASQNTEKSLYFKKFAAAINNLDGVYDYYLSKYGEEPLPKSLKKSDIIKRLYNYAKYAQTAQEKSIYQDFINVLDRKEIDNVHHMVNSLKGTGTMNPEKIRDTFLEAKGFVDEQQDEEMQKAMDDNDYEPDIKMNEPAPCITKDSKHKKSKTEIKSGKGQIKRKK